MAAAKKDQSGTLSIQLIQRLSAIGIALSAEKDINRLLETILVEAKSIAGADGGTLYFRGEGDTLDFAIVRTDSLGIAYGGSTGKPAPMKSIHLYNPETGQPNYGTQAVYATLLRKPINIEDVYNADGFDFEGTKRFDTANNYRTQSVITVPMVSHKNEAIGCLQLINAKDANGKIVPFSFESQQIVHSLASQAAVILDNRQLIQAQTDLLESMIEMIAKAIDTKSPYTSSHCERVPVLTEMLAQAGCRDNTGVFKGFDLTEEDWYELHIAAWLHDCGKITTPVHVMDKATKLETIFDRIELIKTRFELFKRDMKIWLLEEIIRTPDKRSELATQYRQQVDEINSDMEFIQKANIGGEFMADDKLARLKKISERNWNYDGAIMPGLTEEELYNLSIRRGTINNEERKIMNDHMVVTLQMLEALPFPKHLKNVPEIAGGHHERMDGKGYPRGIKAGTMSIPARMMAVADVFEALTAADRPYKPAKKLSEAMAIIGNMKKDNHLDPDMVDLFIRHKIYLEYAKRFLTPELIDNVDEAAILAIKPVPMTA